MEVEVSTEAEAFTEAAAAGNQGFNNCKRN
jgi:hypothetical protein